MMSIVDWRESAACRKRPDLLGDFFKKKINQEIVDLCFDCPVRGECYEYALVNEAFGYWGGSTESQRYARRVELGIPHPAVVGETMIVSRRVEREIDHGTDRGYQQHRIRKIPISDDDSCGCRHAHRVKTDEYRSSQRAARLNKEVVYDR